MNFRGKAITGTSFLMVLGAVCMAAVVVSAAVIMLSVESNSGATAVGNPPLTVTPTTPTDATYTNWGTTATPGNTYDDSITVAGTYTGAYDIKIRIVSTAVITTSDIVMSYDLTGTTYDAISGASWTGSGTNEMTCTVTGETAAGAVNSVYNFIIALDVGAPNGTYTIYYQAVTPEA